MRRHPRRFTVLFVLLAVSLSLTVWRTAPPLAVLTFFCLGFAAGVPFGVSRAREGEPPAA